MKLVSNSSPARILEASAALFVLAGIGHFAPAVSPDGPVPPDVPVPPVSTGHDVWLDTGLEDGLSFVGHGQGVEVTIRSTNLPTLLEIRSYDTNELFLAEDIAPDVPYRYELSGPSIVHLPALRIDDEDDVDAITTLD